VPKARPSSKWGGLGDGRYLAFRALHDASGRSAPNRDPTNLRGV
jgi:hypothetical protein